MTNLIVGSSSGLGKEIFDQLIGRGVEVCGISRYSNQDIYKTHTDKGVQIIKEDLSIIDQQKHFDKIVSTLPAFERVYMAVGGGFGRKDLLPSYEDLTFVYKLNVFVPFCLIRSLYKQEKINHTTKNCFISSIASQEVIASPAYSSSKSALNSICKTATKQQKSQFGSITNFMCGAFEGSGSAFDRLKEKNLEAYNSFVKNRLPNGNPLSTKELASYIIATMNFSTDLLDGLTIKVDGNESFSI